MIPLLFVGALGCPEGFEKAYTGYANISFNEQWLSSGKDISQIESTMFSYVCKNTTDNVTVYPIDTSSQPTKEQMCAVSSGQSTCCATLFTAVGDDSTPSTGSGNMTVECFDIDGYVDWLTENQNMTADQAQMMTGYRLAAKQLFCPSSGVTNVTLGQFADLSLYPGAAYGVECASASSSGDLSTGAIVGIAVGSVAGVGLLGFGIYKMMAGSGRGFSEFV